MEANKQTENTYILVGEEQGMSIDGFMSPNPVRLKDKVANKTVILATTNGTVALKNAVSAKRLLVASLLNGGAVVEEMLARYENETVVVVCSGSSNEFCLEDWLFYTFITLSNELERLGDERFSTFCLSLLSRGWKEQCQ